MAKLFYLHWHEAEAKQRAAALKRAGHRVTLHWSTAESPALKDNLPDIAIISLDRLPSHGRAVAEWLWEARNRQHIPIVFEGGAPEKVTTTQARFPKAYYCQVSRTAQLVSRLAGKASTNAEA